MFEFIWGKCSILDHCENANKTKQKRTFWFSYKEENELKNGENKLKICGKAKMRLNE